MEGTLKMVQSPAIGLTGEPRGQRPGSAARNPLNTGVEPSGTAAHRPPSRLDGAGDVTIDMRVAQLLCSRLCHDLAGPSGAIHNGIELMSEDAAADPAALSLVAGSSTNLNSRLAFYRLTFGLGGGSERTMALAEAKELARGVIANHRMELDWPTEPSEGDDGKQCFAVDEIRLTLGLVLIGADALPRGGKLRVRCVRTAAGTEVSVVARGARAALPEDLLAAMNPDAPSSSLTSRTVHGYFAAALARRLDAAMTIGSKNAEEVTLTVSLPRSWQSDPIPFPTPGSAL